MQRNKKTIKNRGSNRYSSFDRTDPNKVKEDIQKDISQGEGAMTSREAGSMRD